MSSREDDDSDAPEEVSAQQGIQQDEEIRKALRLSKARARHEGKERRKKLAERLTPRMLPVDIVNLLAAREKQVFISDSEDEKEGKKLKPKKKRSKPSGVETVILKELPPSLCVQNSLEFLEKRKKQVPRSAAVLTNSKQALRLLSSSGLLK
uniref:Uncharacterized protein n=1 Tax=Chenopodium quinoa TaxID=63459 RepID=A0A803MCN8_CHEQI